MPSLSAANVRRGWPAIVLGILALILAVVWGAGGSGPSDTNPSASSSSASSTTSGAPSARADGNDDGLQSVAVSDLPAEARDTIALIAKGGPYPHNQDNETFRNREGVLPDQPRGYYREYTVRTPGESDRGARRIVTGRDGTMYYTDDHYDSFRRIDQ